MVIESLTCSDERNRDHCKFLLLSHVTLPPNSEAHDPVDAAKAGLSQVI